MTAERARRFGESLASQLAGRGSPTTRDSAIGSPTTRDSAIGSPTTRDSAIGSPTTHDTRRVVLSSG